MTDNARHGETTRINPMSEVNPSLLASLSRRNLLKLAPATVLLGAAAPTALAQCPDLDGDGNVGASDLLKLLVNWGPAKCPGGFTDFNFFTPTSVVTDFGSGPIVALIDGLLTVSDQGTVNGSLNISWADFPGVKTEILVKNDAVFIVSDGSTIDLQVGDPSIFVLIDGKPVEAPVVLENAYNEWLKIPDPTAWSPTARSVAALTSFARTRVWETNAQTARSVGAKSEGFWCKLSCFAVGADIAAIIAISCAFLLVGCAGASTITLGGLAVPCAFVISLCVGGVFGGWAVAYAGWLEFVWG